MVIIYIFLKNDGYANYEPRLGLHQTIHVGGSNTEKILFKYKCTHNNTYNKKNCNNILMIIPASFNCLILCIGNHMGLSAIWKKIARQ